MLHSTYSSILLLLASGSVLCNARDASHIPCIPLAYRHVWRDEVPDATDVCSMGRQQASDESLLLEVLGEDEGHVGGEGGDVHAGNALQWEEGHAVQQTH